MCVDDPTFNDVARSLLNKGAWEPRLSKHLVKAMLNYPNAVLIGKFSPICSTFYSCLCHAVRYWVKHRTTQPDCGRHAEGSGGGGCGVLQLSPHLPESQDHQQGQCNDPLQLNQVNHHKIPKSHQLLSQWPAWWTSLSLLDHLGIAAIYNSCVMSTYNCDLCLP